MAKILVVDDEASVRTILKRTMENAGHQVIEACDGKEGIKLYHESQPDIMITDIVMPEKEGIEVIMELRQDYPDIKIIAISGGGRQVKAGNSLMIAEKIGACRTFTKPFDRKAVLQTVQNLLEE